jgi:rifampicin phosphotransferase
MDTHRFTQELSKCRDVSLVGGKAASLGRLVHAGFPVPDGFVVTTRAWQLYRQSGVGAVFATSVESTLSAIDDSIPPVVAEEIRAAYRMLGSPIVAVRSSATAEDMADASMAGQYETFLNVQGEKALLDAIWRCWASIQAPRVQAYLSEHGIDPSWVAMAVVVQRQVSADAAGVLFTANPHDGRTHEMLLEASWGLGETVVSGRVQPDVLRLKRETGQVLEAVVADKQAYLAPGAKEESLVEEGRRRQPCLSGRDVYRLWQLARRVAKHFGCPQDIEWAISGGEPYLIQSRPITTLAEAAAYEQLLRTTQRYLRQEAAAGRGPWILHNLAETLPHPTPLTWSIMKRFMSGSGGFGTMYRQAGFEPAPAVEHEGFLACIAGRIYMDATRAPEMLFQDFPFAYDLEDLKRNLDASQSPPTKPTGSPLSRWKAGKKLTAVQARLDALSTDLEHELREGLFEEIMAFAAGAKRMDLGSLPVNELLELWERQERKVLDTFGPRLLLPSLIAATALGALRTFIQETLWDEDADALARRLSSGGLPDRTLLADAELYEVAKGNRLLETWLADHGHRAAGELDLAEPRWREQSAAVQEMADRLGTGEGPLERHRRHVEEIDRQMAALRTPLTRARQREFDKHLSLVQRYIVLREDSKDFLILGYDMLRDLALEAGRRMNIGDDVFYLTRDEVFDSLRVGFAPCYIIEQRKIAYRAEIRLALPRVIDSQVINMLGETPDVKPSAGGYKALAISSGESTGPARIVHSPMHTGELGSRYILVCPSTDPSWTPLFVNAAGLVLECGGTLSHGAIVAREMGLPAVVLPEATKLFHEGEELRIDARCGWVGLADAPQDKQSELHGLRENNGRDGAGMASTFVDPDDALIPQELIPPPDGRKDRKAAKISWALAIVWAVYSIAFFILPQQFVHQPTLKALDMVLWPIVRLQGKPAVVAIVALVLAVLTLLVQKLATDDRRLREAKRRAKVLKRQADLLPKDSSRRTALMNLVTMVQMRTMVAALIPVGLLLGPMMLPFVWFRERVDPAASNAPAGSPVQIVATIDSDWNKPVRIDVPPAMVLDDSTPPSRTLPPIHQTLEHLLSLYRQPHDDPSQPWELKLAPDLGREQTANDLQAYLAAGIPPQGITWLIRPPNDLRGRFSIKVTAGEHPPLSTSIVLGDEVPPDPVYVTGAAGSPIKELRAVYPKPKQESVFWRPPASLGGWLAAFDIGWLWLYIIVYLVSMVLARSVLRVA